MDPAANRFIAPAATIVAGSFTVPVIAVRFPTAELLAPADAEAPVPADVVGAPLQAVNVARTVKPPRAR
jgi:hypothetical protein